MTKEEILKFNIEHVKNAIPGIDKTAGATKEQLAVFFNISVATLNRNLKIGYGVPDHIKGEKKGSRIYFPLINIAKFLTEQTIKTA